MQVLLFHKWKFLEKPIVEGLDLSRLSLLWEKKDFIKMQINSSIDFQQKMEEPEYDDELWRWKKET